MYHDNSNHKADVQHHIFQFLMYKNNHLWFLYQKVFVQAM